MPAVSLALGGHSEDGALLGVLPALITLISSRVVAYRLYNDYLLG